MIKIGVDIGGTFTDFACLKNDNLLFSIKVSSTPRNLIEGVIEGIKRTQGVASFSYDEIERFIHGTTVATNIMLEKNGARLGILTTEGFEDVLEIGRLNKTEMYNILIDEQTPTFLADRKVRIGIRERMDCHGSIVIPLDEEDVLRQVTMLREKYGIEAIAVCYLFSFKNPIHELRTREIIRKMYPEMAVSLSCEVDPIFREYERLCMTAFDAYLKPKVARYLVDLGKELKKMNIGAVLQIMQSSGGITSSEIVKDKPVSLLLSGPAGGVIGGSFAGRLSGFNDIITLDMGGTSCDVSLVKDNKPILSREGRIIIYPMRARMIDVNTIGAGGGSIAYLDAGGGLRVGPQSGGADPGPACYGKGGQNPTVTDASVVLGYLNPDYFAGGDIVLNKDLAIKAIEKISVPLKVDMITAGYGIHKIVNSNMSNQIRLVSIARGHDPRKFALLLFGGAGPLHGGALMRELGIGTAIVPPSPGVLSAFGLLIANIEHHTSRTYCVKIKNIDLNEMMDVFRELTLENEEKMQKDKGPPEKVVVHRSVDMRYVGQSYEIEVPVPLGELNDEVIRQIVSSFHDLHKLTYGHSDSEMPVEFVNLRISHSYPLDTPKGYRKAVGKSSLEEAQKGYRDAFFGESFGLIKTPIYQRERLPAGKKIVGPVIIEQIDTTTVVYPNQVCHVDEIGSIIIHEGG